MENYNKIIEALLFASTSPLTEDVARECISRKSFKLDEVIEQLNKRYKNQGINLNFTQTSFTFSYYLFYSSN